MDELDAHQREVPESHKFDRLILCSLARLTQILQRMIRAKLEDDSPNEKLEKLHAEHRLESETLESLLLQRSRIKSETGSTE
jgi:hypothetical protein